MLRMFGNIQDLPKRFQVLLAYAAWRIVSEGHIDPASVKAEIARAIADIGPENAQNGTLKIDMTHSRAIDTAMFEEAERIAAKSGMNLVRIIDIVRSVRVAIKQNSVVDSSYLERQLQIEVGADLDVSRPVSAEDGIFRNIFTKQKKVRAIELFIPHFGTVWHFYNLHISGYYRNSETLVIIDPHDATVSAAPPSSRSSTPREAALPKAPARASFTVGSYRLDDPIGDLTGLVEFSAEEYRVMVRRFKGERNYNAPSVQFLGRPWKLMLQTVNGQISKIAPHIETTSKFEANQIAVAVLEFCIEHLGRPSEQKTGLFIWDTTDGDVILQTTETMEGLAINLFLTSRSVRHFERL